MLSRMQRSRLTLKELNWARKENVLLLWLQPSPELSFDIELKAQSKHKNALERTVIRTRFFCMNSKRTLIGHEKRFRSCINALGSRVVKSTSGSGTCSVRQKAIPMNKRSKTSTIARIIH